MIKLGIYIIMSIQVISSIPFWIIGFLWQSLIRGGLRAGIDDCNRMEAWMSRTVR